jgi:hypothetical protein
MLVTRPPDPGLKVVYRRHREGRWRLAFLILPHCRMADVDHPVAVHGDVNIVELAPDPVDHFR